MNFPHSQSHIHATKHRLTADPNGMRDAVNIEQHIHFLEIHAYSSLLKAFIAQSDLLSWGKEGLLTELRRELNIADFEHGEILTKISSDESIKWIREHMKMASHSHAQDYIKANTTGCPSASIGNSVIRLKVPSSASLYPQENISRSQASRSSFHIPSSLPMSNIGPRKTLKLNENLLLPPEEMFNHDVQLLPIGRGSVPKGNCQFVHGNVEPPKEMFNCDVQLPSIGRGSVPKGNCQYIRGNAEPPKEMFNCDVQLPPIGRGSVPKGNCQFVRGNAEPPKEMFNSDVQLQPIGRGSVPKGNYQFHPSESVVLNKKSDLIQIRPTDRIIHDVEMLFSRENPDPVDVERAKQTLNEQEKALLEALGKLEDVLGDDGAQRNVQNYSGRTRDFPDDGAQQNVQNYSGRTRDFPDDGAQWNVQNYSGRTRDFPDDGAQRNVQNYSGRTRDDDPW